MNNGNFKLYNASAGSGKTFTLIKEFLLLSLSSDYPNFKNILAVTFTNKAANEMKMKVLNNWILLHALFVIIDFPTFFFSVKLPSRTKRRNIAIFPKTYDYTL